MAWLVKECIDFGKRRKRWRFGSGELRGVRQESYCICYMVQSISYLPSLDPVRDSDYIHIHTHWVF